MSSPAPITTERPTTVALYERPLVPVAFDALISTVFAPFGGVNGLRARALDLLAVRPGLKVLELGCGTGGITKLLVARGADVTSIDGSNRMLARARQRAPQARFEQQQLESLELAGKFDLVLFAFVLHELPPGLLAKALSSACGAVAADGAVAVLDHAVPKTGILARAWRKFLQRMEGPGVADCIERGYDAELTAAGLHVVAHHELARGTAALWIAAPSAA